MNRKLKALLFVSLICFFAPHKGNAQNSSAFHAFQFGLYGGVSQYHGDISTKTWSSKFSGETKFSFGALARYHFNDKHGLGVQFQRSALYSEKQYKSDGTTLFDRKFQGDFNQVSLHSYINFSNFFFGDADRKVEFYGTLGIGYAFWNADLSKLSDGTLVHNNSSAPGAGFATNGFSFPASVGLNFLITPEIKLSVEANMITALTDEIDFYRDGYQYDIITAAHIGISYSIGAKMANKTKKIKAPSVATKWEPETPISIIDYEIYNDPPAVMVKTETTIPPLTLPEKQVVPEQNKNTGFEFRVQIYAKSSPVQIGSKVYRNVQFEYPVVENQYNGLYRYSTGSFKSYSEAESYARTMQSRGIYDAFVVAYSNNERITISPEMKNKK